MCGRGAGCLYGVGTYLPDIVGQGCSCLIMVRTYLRGTVGQGCRLFKLCRFLPPEQVRGADLDTVLLLFED